MLRLSDRDLPMRIAILSDIHGNFPALEAVVADFTRRGVDAIVNLGDSLSGPLLPLETAQFLMTQDWVHLAGNHERQLLSHRSGERGASDEYAHSQLAAREFAWLSSLQPTVRLRSDLFLCHGTPRSDLEYFLETVEPAFVRAATSIETKARVGTVDAALIACGHTHIPRLVRAPTGQVIINPGSVGLPAYDDVLPHPHVMETGSPDARYAIVERVADGWTAGLFAVPYRHEAMVKLAEARERPDWARALSSGFMS
jgi:putative phosphoesterase